MRCVIVSHTHWDREWYRTYQAFRARLVDTVDQVLDLIARDGGYHFQLDGQSIVIEDYLEVRPQRRKELETAVRSGRIAIGPWYVQPDSLLPSGEAHVRNLLEGRRVAMETGACSKIAYTPDSFGHPSQFPQIFAGFGLDPFIYWRGHGNEFEDLPAEYFWQAPDGTQIRACHLGKGYFGAWGFGSDITATVARLRTLAGELGERATSETVLLMNGIDHMLPDANTQEVSEELAKATGWTVERGLLDDYADGLAPLAASFQGELLGGKVAHLLPGVWSTRTPLKLHNRRCETLLEAWAEPWAALARFAADAPDERAALRAAWRGLLPNQAHDSICGCSQDRVHEQMVYRFDNAEELARETATRCLERIAGLGVERQLPSDAPLEIAVFNPSPHPRTDVVALSLEGYPAFTSKGINPLLACNLGIEGLEIDGRPVRLVEHTENTRPHVMAGHPVYDLEFVAEDLPAFGWRRFTLEKSAAAILDEDDGREIASGDLSIRVADDGTLDVRFGEQRFAGLGAIEDVGDRGDTYDFDPVPGEPPELREVSIRRSRHPSGIQHLEVRRRLGIPKRLSEDRQQRSSEIVDVQVVVEARIAPGVHRVDLRVCIENTAEDHRLRLLFPTAERTASFQAATTFDSITRSTDPVDAAGWIHPAPSTIPHQGWVSTNELTVAAPGLPEAEVTPDGVIAITLLRSVGWLSRGDLTSRTGEAGPALPTPGAQCLHTIEAKLALLPGCDPRGARDAEVGLRSVGAGSVPLVPPDVALLEIGPRELLLSALKPAEDGDGLIVRVLNPSDAEIEAHLVPGFEVQEALPVRLDEGPADHEAVHKEGSELCFPVPGHALRSLRLRV